MGIPSGQTGGEAEHAGFAGGAGQLVMVEGAECFGPIDTRHRGAVGQGVGGVHEGIEEVVPA